MYEGVPSSASVRVNGVSSSGRSSSAVASASSSRRPVLATWQLEDHAQAGETRTVDREQFLAVLGSQEAFGSHARVMPAVNDEVFGGYRLYGLRPNTPLKAFGFYNGDTLVAIDQRPMAPAVQWEEVVQATVADGEVEILVKRKNEGVPLRFRFTDGTAAK